MSDLMIVKSLPSLYPMKEFEEKALKRVIGCAEKYNNDWIPCSERLPEKNQRCLIQYNGSMSGNNDYIDVDTYNGERFEFFGIIGVIAWQPLPAPYQKGE